MKATCFIGLLLILTSSCLPQDYPRPTFPDVFQTEIEGTFVGEKAVVEIDATIFYDRTNNRAALFVTKEGDLMKLIYNFDSDESLSIDGKSCEVNEIQDEERFFPVTIVKGKKQMAGADEVFFFTKSVLDPQSSSESSIPTLVYTAHLDIPQHGKTNCDITHIFSKPDLERSTCKEGVYCNSTLLSISVICKDNQGGIDVDHNYRFSRFKSAIDDESVFLPPVGIYCKMKNTKVLPKFPSYFSFSFDVIERPKDSKGSTAVFNTHKQVWYDAEYKIIRIDEFSVTGLLYSSRIFDMKAEIAFTIIPSILSCDLGPLAKDVRFDEITLLPKAFFSDSSTENPVYVGKRKVHGLDYDVWSLSWIDKESEAMVVEEIYFLQVSADKDASTEKEQQLQISHVDTYVYEMDEKSDDYELTLLKYFSINNFRTAPKEWVAFDVATCFQNKEKIDFILKIEGLKLVKESQSYAEALQLLYDKIITITGISIVRISELMGIFDGTHLLGFRGSILNNSKSSGWPKDSKEPGMEKVFDMIKQAISEKKLSFTFKGENNIEIMITVTSVKAVQVTSDEFPKPTFPDVFQTQIEGIFVDENGVESMHASIYYDMENNRAALFVTKDDDRKKLIYSFDSDEMITINDNDCNVDEIEEQLFVPFTLVNGKKTLARGEEAFAFSKSKLDKQIFPDNNIPTLVYTANINIPQYGDINCDVTHIFSKPDFLLPTCNRGLFCTPTLLSMTVKCKDEDGQVDVNNTYRFSGFKSEIEDESVFLVPAGIYCNRTNTKDFPYFPSYFSFTFDIVEKPEDSGNDSSIFTTHKEVWYDANYKIIRIDEFDNNGLLYSSRVLDLKAEAAFTIIASIPTCDVGPIAGEINFDEITRLPKAFFAQNEVKNVIYIGKRKVHGMDYEVWSLSWKVKDSETRIVEEIYFLEVTLNKEPSSENTSREIYLQISHVDMYTYEQSEEYDKYDLTLLKYFSINNYRSKPKEWAAFDVDTCFTHKQKKEFIMKVEGPSLVKGSQSYREVLELLYDKIIAYTGVSIVRISELTGIFDGVQLTGIRGSILDNPDSSGWPKRSKEPNMEETFNLLKKAALEKKLSITFKGENNIDTKLNVTSVEAAEESSSPKHDCFSGVSLAAASLVLLLMGVAFGISGYYVFLKKRKPSNVLIRMSDIEEEPE